MAVYSQLYEGKLRGTNETLGLGTNWTRDWQDFLAKFQEVHPPNSGAPPRVNPSNSSVPPSSNTDTRGVPYFPAAPTGNEGLW
jgi:hypothetical protein